VHVDPIKPTLKAPGTQRLKLKHDKLLSNLLQFWFQNQLAALHQGPGGGGVVGGGDQDPGTAVQLDSIKTRDESNLV